MYGSDGIWEFGDFETEDLKEIQKANTTLRDFGLENEDMAAEVDRELESRGISE